MALLDSVGFTSVVATDCEQEYMRPLVLGDRLAATSSSSRSPPMKKTALGEGHFFTTRLEYTDAAGELVATMRFRILKFRPAAPSALTRSRRLPRRPMPAITHDNSFFFEGAARGELLIQRCESCGTLRHPPRPGCPKCRSLDWGTVSVERPRDRLQLRRRPLPAGAGFRVPAAGRAGRARRGDEARVEHRGHRARRDLRSACRSRWTSRTTPKELDASRVPAGRRGRVLMDFAFDEAQQAVSESAEAVFGGIATNERVAEVEKTADRFDERLWSELAAANLLGLSIPGDARRIRSRPHRDVPGARAAGKDGGAGSSVGDASCSAPFRSPGGGPRNSNRRGCPGVVTRRSQAVRGSLGGRCRSGDPSPRSSAVADARRLAADGDLLRRSAGASRCSG